MRVDLHIDVRYVCVFGVIPPLVGGLYIEGIGLQFVEEEAGSVGEGGGGVGGADEGEGAFGGGVGEGGEGVGEGSETVGHAVVDVAFDVGVADETMDDFCDHNNYIGVSAQGQPK